MRSNMEQFGVCIEKCLREEAKRILDVRESSWYADMYVEQKMDELK